MFTRVKTLVGLVVLWAAPVLAQQPVPQPPVAPPALPAPPVSTSTRICGQDVEPPKHTDGTPSLPPPGSGPVLYQYGVCFEEQGGASVTDPETYLYYIQLKPTLP